MKKDGSAYIKFPDPYDRRTLNALYRDIPLKDTTSRLLRKYFDAASCLYGVIPLRKLYEIIASQNKDLVTEEEFLAFARIARHEREAYYILGSSELYLDAPDTDFMDYEIIHLEMVLTEDLYYKVSEAQQGKPYYVPKKKEFLAYTDICYWEVNPETVAFRDYLLTKTGDEYLMEDIFTMIYHGCHFRSAGFQEAIDRLEEFGDIEFESEADIDTFIKVYTAFHNNARTVFNRGYTPSELAAMDLAKDRVPKALVLGKNIRKAIADGTMDLDELRNMAMSSYMPNEEYRQLLLDAIDEVMAEADPKKSGHKKKYMN